jgi:hypothetical protein
MPGYTPGLCGESIRNSGDYQWKIFSGMLLIRRKLMMTFSYIVAGGMRRRGDRIYGFLHASGHVDAPAPNTY